jgi:hypothetical protein
MRLLLEAPLEALPQTRFGSARGGWTPFGCALFMPRTDRASEVACPIERKDGAL